MREATLGWARVPLKHIFGQPQLLRGNAQDEAGWVNPSQPCTLWKPLDKLGAGNNGTKSCDFTTAAHPRGRPRSQHGRGQWGARSGARPPAAGALGREGPHPCPLPASAGPLPSDSLRDTPTWGSEGPIAGAIPPISSRPVPRAVTHRRPGATAARRAAAPVVGRRHAASWARWGSCRRRIHGADGPPPSHIWSRAAQRRDPGRAPGPPSGGEGTECGGSARAPLGWASTARDLRGKGGRGAEGRTCPTGCSPATASPGAGRAGREGAPGHACGPCPSACLVSSGPCTTPPFSSWNSGETGRHWIASFILCKHLAGCRAPFSPSSEVGALWGSWSCRSDVGLINFDPVHSEGLNMSVLPSAHRMLDTTAQLDHILHPLTACVADPVKAHGSQQTESKFQVFRA